MADALFRRLRASCIADEEVVARFRKALRELVSEELFGCIERVPALYRLPETILPLLLSFRAGTCGNDVETGECSPIQGIQHIAAQPVVGFSTMPRPQPGRMLEMSCFGLRFIKVPFNNNTAS